MLDSQINDNLNTTNNTQNIQIMYHKNMEFFKTYNTKLFHALTQAPQEYNLQIDSYGFNIIHLASQKLHYPFIHKQNSDDITTQVTPHTHESSMIQAHKELANRPMKNPKWKLLANFNLNIESNFIDETRLPITGKYANAMFKTCIEQTLLSYENGELILTQLNPNDSIDSYSDLLYQQKDCKKHLQSHFSADISQTLSLTSPNEANALSQNLESHLQKNLSKKTNFLLFNHLLESFEDSKFLPQTTIYGLMGGLFLQDLLNQGYFFHSLLIYEENIDLFRVSLYFLDYKQLFNQVGEKSCFIIIKDISEPLVRAFLHTKKLTNNILSLELKHYQTPKVIALQNLIFKEKKSIMRGWGSFEDEVIGFKNALKNLKSCKLLMPNIHKINAPICVVGNGPSLDLNIDFIKANQDRMIIFSCGTALKVLRHHGIKPDFQIEIERIDYLSNVLKEANLDDIPLIFAQTTDCKAVALSVESFAFMRGGSNSAYLDSNAFVLEFSAPFVGNAGVALGLLFGSDCILCGIDCGYIQGYGKHAQHSFYGEENTEIPKDCFEVQANKNLKVYSNDLFYLSARNIEEAIKFYHSHHVLNLGYGIKIEGALSINEDDFSLQHINKAQEIQNLKLNFKPHKVAIQQLDILQPLNDFLLDLEKILDSKVQDLKALFNMIDRISALLQQYIAEIKNRKSIILIEGTSLHLSFSLLLSMLFSGYFIANHYDKTSSLETNLSSNNDLLVSNKKSYDIIKGCFKQALQTILAECSLCLDQ